MNTRLSDFECLHRYVRAGDQAAFRELVYRHIDLVFGTALRKVGDSGGAEEIAQNVFSALARKAWRFAPDDSLPAWLHKSAILESQGWFRAETRRRQREATAAELGTTMKTPEEAAAFKALIPALDEALLSLREHDRTALLLRYYESRSLREVGTVLGVSEDTAQKRVQSALERLAHFFQRRGLKTVTVGTTVAALEFTNIPASAGTASGAFSAAMQAAPATFVGLGAWLHYVASLSKLQTAAVCLALAAIPAGWQWHEESKLRDELAQASAAHQQRQSELTGVQADLLRLHGELRQREAELSQANADAAEHAALAARVGDWRSQLRQRLLASDYQWPEDLSYVRIPKSAVPELNVGRPITRPGRIAPETRELLGLSPEERGRLEDLLQNHYAAMDRLAGSSFYKTNSSTFAHIPSGAMASNVWVVPKLGEAAKWQADQVKSGLEEVLHGDRWAMLSRGLGGYGMGTLETILGLEVADRRSEVAVWFTEIGGEVSVSSHLTGDIGDRGTYWSSGLPAIPLRYLIANDFDGVESAGLSWVGDRESIPAPVNESMLAWIREVGAQFTQEGAK